MPFPSAKTAVFQDHDTAAFIRHRPPLIPHGVTLTLQRMAL